MSAGVFYFKSVAIVGYQAIVSLRAVTTDAEPRVIVDDQDGDEHSVSADQYAGSTPEEQAEAGAKSWIANVAAARQGIELTPADLQRIAPPA